MLAQMPDDRHFVEARLCPAGFDFGDSLGLLLRRQFQCFQVLERGRQVGLHTHAFAVDIAQRGAQVFAVGIDGGAGTRGTPNARYRCRWRAGVRGRCCLPNRPVSFRRRPSSRRAFAMRRLKSSTRKRLRRISVSRRFIMSVSPDSRFSRVMRNHHPATRTRPSSARRKASRRG